MWQGVGACGRVRGSGRGQANSIDVKHVTEVGWCGRVWGHVAGCGGMWQRWWQGVGACGRGRYVVGGQAYGMDGDVVGVGACGTGCGGM